jgi:hypothetical protein
MLTKCGGRKVYKAVCGAAQRLSWQRLFTDAFKWRSQV